MSNGKEYTFNEFFGLDEDTRFEIVPESNVLEGELLDPTPIDRMHEHLKRYHKGKRLSPNATLITFDSISQLDIEGEVVSPKAMLEGGPIEDLIFPLCGPEALARVPRLIAILGAGGMQYHRPKVRSGEGAIPLNFDPHGITRNNLCPEIPEENLQEIRHAYKLTDQHGGMGVAVEVKPDPQPIRPVSLGDILRKLTDRPKS
jgi:hypothetical protein